MAQSLSQQTVNNFVGGLVTESTELTSPENSSVDELNCELLIDGSRRRRRGIQRQTGGAASTYVVPTDALVHHEIWRNVNEDGGLIFLVLQLNNFVTFYNMSGYPVSDHQMSYSIQLTDYKANNNIDIKDHPIQTATINGKLVIVNPGMEAILVEYDQDAHSFSVRQLPQPKIRDFEWQGDTYTYFKDDRGPSTERMYDTYNAGWGPDELSTYKDETEKWPRLTHPWWTAHNLIDSDGDLVHFWEEVWEQDNYGSRLTANGHIILNLFYKDRRKVVLNEGGKRLNIPVETIDLRFSACEAYAGRVFFGGLGDNKVYFSKIVEDDNDVTKFYQQNDPTVQDLNDLLDSDGGVMTIAGAQNIKRLVVFGSSLIVFADNGIWEIKGPDGVFKATEFYVTKISTTGMANPRTYVDVEGVPFWWSKFGIHSLTRNEVSLQAEVANLSKTSIQSLFDDISVEAKLNATGVYDSHNKVVSWLYSNDVTNPYKYNRVLNLNIPLKAFYPWEFSDEDASTDFIVGASFWEGYSTSVESEDVVVNGTTITHNGDTVTVEDFVMDVDTDPRVVYFVKDNNSSTAKLHFADTSQYGFKDWGTEDYDSYVEAAFNFMGDLTTNKKGLLITTYMKVTEDGWVDTGDGYELRKPSSCYLKPFWDLRTNPSSQQQIYRLKRVPVVNESNLNEFDPERDVNISRSRIKGKGRVLKLRFESDEDKDWHLLGYELLSMKQQSL